MVYLKFLFYVLLHVSIAVAEVTIRGASTATFKPICYDDYGCFVPRPGFILYPQSPEKVNTEFFLYTRNNPTEATSISTLTLDSFDATKPLKVIIHGFLDRATNKWILNMIKELLLSEDMNVIAVDWSGGNQFPYGQAVANTVIAAAATRLLLQAMINKGIQPQQIHLIGHSLGAHISGYVGRELPNLGRISGLDPAGPEFYTSETPDRLDPSDALFVDIIHTNDAPNIIEGFGDTTALGHVDFYPNGGSSQPTCAGSTGSLVLETLWTLASTWNIEKTGDTVACNHLAAVLYYTDSINTFSPAYGYPCHNYSTFVQGLCTSCDLNGQQCQRAGYHASPNRTLGTLYMMTIPEVQPPHFGYQFMVTLVSATNNAKQARGDLKIKFNTLDEGTLLFDQNTLMKPGVSKSKTILLTSNPIPLKEISISFQKSYEVLFGIGFADEWSFQSVVVVDMQSNIEYTFCSKSNSSPMIKSGSRVAYQLCA